MRQPRCLVLEFIRFKPEYPEVSLTTNIVVKRGRIQKGLSQEEQRFIRDQDEGFRETESMNGGQKLWRSSDDTLSLSRANTEKGDEVTEHLGFDDAAFPAGEIESMSLS